MNRIQRCLSVLATLGSALVTFAAAAPAARPPRPRPTRTPTPASWRPAQIALIIHSSPICARLNPGHVRAVPMREGTTRCAMTCWSPTW
jgi:hypothetical protein